MGTRQRGKSRPAGHHEVPPTLITYPPKPSSRERCEKTAGERVGAKERHLPGFTAPGRAVLHGAKVWGVAFLKNFCKSEADNFPTQITVDENKNYPFFLCPYPTGATSKTAPLNKEKENSPPSGGGKSTLGRDFYSVQDAGYRGNGKESYHE